MTRPAASDRAFGIELEASRPALMRLATRLSHDHAIAECLVQSTLLRAWRSRGQLRDLRALRGWLFSICRRENARMYDRKQHPTIDIDSLVPEQQPAVADVDPVEAREIRMAVLSLHEMYRVPIVLQVVEGWSTAEIAGHLGIPRETVLTRLFRARRLLRARLQADRDMRDGSRPVSAGGPGQVRASSPRRAAR